MKVYFVAGAELVKIGSSMDPMARLKDLRAMCPVPLEMVAYYDGFSEDEHDLHERFSRLRHHNEWFLDQSPIRDYLRECSEAGRLTWTGPRRTRRNRPIEESPACIGDAHGMFHRDYVRLAAIAGVGFVDLKRLYNGRHRVPLPYTTLRVREVAARLGYPLPPERAP